MTAEILAEIHDEIAASVTGFFEPQLPGFQPVENELGISEPASRPWTPRFPGYQPWKDHATDLYLAVARK